jgi:hypothetical protein
MLIVALLTSSTLMRSSSLPIVLETEAEVARVIASAGREVSLFAPSLRSRVVANALRRSAVEGGVRVFLLMDAAFIEQRSSFIPALSVIQQPARVEVRLQRGLSSAWLVADGRQVVFGPLVAEPSAFGLDQTRLVLDQREAQMQARDFAQHWRKATPWRYRVQSPRFTNGGRK